MAKEVINLRKTLYGKYEVESLTNRIEPTVGDYLSREKVEELLEMARNRLPECPLTINIKNRN